MIVLVFNKSFCHIVPDSLIHGFLCTISYSSIVEDRCHLLILLFLYTIICLFWFSNFLHSFITSITILFNSLGTSDYRFVHSFILSFVHSFGNIIAHLSILVSTCKSSFILSLSFNDLFSHSVFRHFSFYLSSTFFFLLPLSVSVLFYFFLSFVHSLSLLQPIRLIHSPLVTCNGTGWKSGAEKAIV